MAPPHTTTSAAVPAAGPTPWLVANQRQLLRYMAVMVMTAVFTSVAMPSVTSESAQPGEAVVPCKIVPPSDGTSPAAGASPFQGALSTGGGGGSGVPAGVALPPPPPEAGGDAEAFINAVAVSRRDGDACVAPIVCQRGAGCVATNAHLSSLAACDWTLPELDAGLAGGARVVVVEVGTNESPETAKLPAREGRYTIAVDPLHAEGRKVWQKRAAPVFVSAAVAPERGAANFSVASVMSSMANVQAKSQQRDHERRNGAAQPAALVPLSEIMERLAPANVEARLLLVDAQGFDTSVVLSAGAAQLKRFRYVVIECQELWPDHPKRYSPNSPNCTAAIARLEAEGGLVFVACMRNIALSEYNCLFAQRDDPVMSDPALVAEAKKSVANLHFRVQTKSVDPWRMSPSYSIQQLRHFVRDADDAADLSTVMCYMYNQPRPPNCPVIVEPFDLLDYDRACKFWAGLCQRGRGLAPEPRCKAAVENRCNDPLRPTSAPATRRPRRGPAGGGPVGGAASSFRDGLPAVGGAVQKASGI